ncbi:MULTISPECIES: N-acetyltransferase [Eisenbergiella]|uniref:N-acetyltransferase n=1 Tax=Eisenbergiella porci TaxID=2652274 RepID=A0A6N7WDJ2_9FIRM|nr:MULTISPECIES: N-acetyltransferase [Eisenbergiella]MDY2654104.1 N-acetyltransferase [Eisenbergiella porci]MSS87510.1 N-acetyltransferase [Eisenbergiella porci]
MIRKFRNEDLEQIMQLWLQSNIQAHSFIEKTYWKSHYNEVRKMLPEAEIYVFDSGEGILGFLGLQEDYIAGIFVEENSRGRGIGKHLLHCAKQNRDSLSLHVFTKNERAVRFYEKEGFKITGEQSDEETGEREYVMEWEKVSTL